MEKRAVFIDLIDLIGYGTAAKKGEYGAIMIGLELDAQ
jgi:hypothetical protein